MSSDPRPTNRINPAKLLTSKWTAVTPTRREKHFMVIEVLVDETLAVTEVDIEAVITGRVMRIPWTDLRDAEQWRTGWR